MVLKLWEGLDDWVTSNLDSYEREKIEATLASVKHLAGVMENYLSMVKYCDENGISIEWRTLLDDIRRPWSPAGPDNDLLKLSILFEQWQHEIARNLTKEQGDDIYNKYIKTSEKDWQEKQSEWDNTINNIDPYFAAEMDEIKITAIIQNMSLKSELLSFEEMWIGVDWYRWFKIYQWKKISLYHEHPHNHITLWSKVRIKKDHPLDSIWDFQDWEIAYIVWFNEPYKSWYTDDILDVSNWKHTYSLKLSRIELI
jgi:hypothetical protein